jgi:uncharacterized protein (DUF362 family)
MLVRVGGTVAVAAGAAWATKRFYDPKGDAGLPVYPGATLKNYFAKIHDSFGASTPRISVARGAAGSDGEVSRETIRRMITAALAPMGGLERFIERGDTVLIKPNVAFDRGPRMGATTNPDVLAEMIRMCHAVGAAKVIVADNPIEKPEPCFAKSRTRWAAEAEGAELILPSQGQFRSVAIRDRDPNPAAFEALGTWEVFYRPLERADKVIGLPPIKDHNLCFASMSMKNWYGLLCGRRNQFHQAIHNIVSDLGMMISPTLVVVDGTRVLMKNGPTGGRLEDVAIGGVMGRPSIVASVDPVASDAWCCQHLLGRDPAAGVRYLELAEQKIQSRIEAGRDEQALRSHLLADASERRRASGEDPTPDRAEQTRIESKVSQIVHESKRFASRDWQAYARSGLIAEANI